jgi:hypothetical protein
MPLIPSSLKEDREEMYHMPTKASLAAFPRLGMVSCTDFLAESSSATVEAVGLKGVPSDIRKDDEDELSSDIISPSP